MNELISQQVGHYHSYVQLVATAHMTWFAFHFGANAAALTLLEKVIKVAGSSYFRLFQLFRQFVFWANIAGGVASCFIALYYFRATCDINALLTKFANEDGTPMKLPEHFPSALPLPLFVGIATAIAIVCFALAIVWHAARHVRPSEELDAETHLENQDSK